MSRRNLRPALALVAAGTAAALSVGAPAMASASQPSSSTPPSAARIAMNRPPVVADDGFTVASGHAISISWKSVLANDSDPDGNVFAPASAKEPVNGTIDYDGLLPSGNISYTSTPGFTGVEKLAYTVKDSKGLQSAAGFIIITVVANHTPVGVADSYTAQSGLKITVAAPGVLANDTDADGDLPKSTAVLTAGPQHGTATLKTTGGLLYTPTAGYVGQDVLYYRVVDGFGGQSAVTPVIVNVTKANFSVAPAPVIKGTAKVGEGLIAGVGSWTPTPTGYSYQWKRDGVSIPGATQNSYLLTPADAGKAITVTGTGTRIGFDTLVTESLPTAPVALGSLSWGNIQFTGDALVGSTLSVKLGAWTPGPVALTQQWLRNGVPIPGATGTSYTLTNADWNTSIRLAVTGSRAGYATATHESSGSPAVRKPYASAPKPVIAGALKVGTVATAKTGSWSPAPTSFSYEWRRDNVPIMGATKKTYTIRTADAGHTLTVLVTPTKAGYYYLGGSAESLNAYPTK